MSNIFWIDFGRWFTKGIKYFPWSCYISPIHFATEKLKQITPQTSKRPLRAILLTPFFKNFKHCSKKKNTFIFYYLRFLKRLNRFLMFISYFDFFFDKWLWSLYISISSTYFLPRLLVDVSCKMPNIRISCSVFPTGSREHTHYDVNLTSRRLWSEKMTQNIF